MNKSFSQYSLIEHGHLGEKDIDLIEKCRGNHNRLGFAYQLIFIRLFNRVPCQEPFEVIEEIVIYAAMQLALESSLVSLYSNRKNIYNHQKTIITYLEYSSFNSQTQILLKDFIFQKALQFEPLSLLLIKSVDFLRDLKILLPAEDTLLRIIKAQRASARQLLFEKIHACLSPVLINKLDSLLEVTIDYSPLENLKSPVKSASADTILNLIERADHILTTGALQVNLTHVNNNYQRTLANEVKRCTVDRIKKMKPTRRYTALVCFLQQAYQNNIDLLISSYIKLVNAAHTRANTRIDKKFKGHDVLIRDSLSHYEKIKSVIRDESIPDGQLRIVLYERFPEELEKDHPEMSSLVTGKTTQVFKSFTHKYAYFRQFTPKLFALLTLQSESNNADSPTLKALNVLNQLNKDNKRSLPQNIPTGFISKPLKNVIINSKGVVDRHAWECALYLKIRDEIKQGNINVSDSKCFSSIKNFFLENDTMTPIADDFFQRSGFPKERHQVREYFTKRLAKAYERYVTHESDNEYAKVVEGKWSLSRDMANALPLERKKELDEMKAWLSKRMRLIKLPELLIEVDNDIHFTEALILPSKNKTLSVEAIFGVLATVMAHGCNIGPFTMSQIIEGISYKEICRITDWQLTNDAMRVALSWVVNAMSKLGITKKWGDGKTSSSDGHLKPFNQKVAQQSYQARIGDFALTFYTFVANNYAPFHSKPFDAAEGEGPHALDGFLYNESDLPLEEHFTDTRAAATILFAAFGWYGQKYSPRIKGIQNHHIYFIDPEMDYGRLAPLLKHKEALINISYIEEHWEEMAQFYASIEQGNVTASVALRRLLSLSKKNVFYKANLHLGRILKTEHTLAHMSDQDYRKRKHQGLLKGEEVHQLGRNISFANRGKITNRDVTGQEINCHCLTLILACVIYWQAKELDQLVSSVEFKERGFDPDLIQHISPVSWDNVVLYGEYIIDKSLIHR
jgi:TnpA family transposase